MEEACGYGGGGMKIRRTTSTKVRTSSNVISPFKDHFSIIPSHLTRKINDDYPGTKISMSRFVNEELTSSTHVNH